MGLEGRHYPLFLKFSQLGFVVTLEFIAFPQICHREGYPARFIGYLCSTPYRRILRKLLF
jgi:hypothetical protein